MEKFKRNQKGITLIALIVTIIVLLILAGISITTLTGENGLITRTTGAVEKKKEAAALEEVKLAMEAVKIDKKVAGGDIVLNIFTEATNVEGRNALEKELYTQDDNVIAAIEDEYLVVDYKGYEFVFDGDFGVTIGKNNKVVITVTPIIGTATVSSLNISSNIVGLDDLSQIEKRYYSVDNGICNACVCTLTGLYISCHSLGEKLHRHLEHLPHIGGTAHQRHFSAYP